MHSRKERPNGMRFGDWGGRYGVPHDQPYVTYDSAKSNPLIVDRKYVLIKHKYFRSGRGVA